MNLGDFLSRAAERLAFGDTPRLDAQVLAARLLNQPRAWVLAHPDFEIEEKTARALEAALRRLEAGEPLPYVLGEWEFFGLRFEITPDVLIPRPETELLVEQALAFLKSSEKTGVADVGTGSGAIAVALAVHYPAAQIWATDVSRAALQVARRNARLHRAESRIRFVECDLLPSPRVLRPASLDLLCANLPYIPTETLRGLPVYGREPTLALDGGADGLDLFRRLFARAPQFLAPNALLLLELESTLGEATLNLAADYFPRARLRLIQDLAGKDRLLRIETRA